MQVQGQAKIQGQGQAKVQGQGQKRDAGDMTPNIETDPKAVQSAERYTKALLNQITGLRLQCTEIEQAMAGDQSWSWLTQLPQTQLYQKAKNAFETAKNENKILKLLLINRCDFGAFVSIIFILPPARSPPP